VVVVSNPNSETGCSNVEDITLYFSKFSLAKVEQGIYDGGADRLFCPLLSTSVSLTLIGDVYMFVALN
jgi:hypothetical protein